MHWDAPSRSLYRPLQWSDQSTPQHHQHHTYEAATKRQSIDRGRLGGLVRRSSPRVPAIPPCQTQRAMTFRPGLVHDRAIRGARDKVAPLDFGAIQSSPARAKEHRDKLDQHLATRWPSCTHAFRTGCELLGRFKSAHSAKCASPFPIPASSPLAVIHPSPPPRMSKPEQTWGALGFAGTWRAHYPRSPARRHSGSRGGGGGKKVDRTGKRVMKAFKCLHSARLELPKKKFGRRKFATPPPLEQPRMPRKPQAFFFDPGLPKGAGAGDSPFSAE